MGLIDDLNRTKQEKNGLLASLDKAKAEQPNRPLSTTVKDIGVSVGAGVPNVLGTLADVVDMATGDSIDVVGQFGDAAKGVGQQILNEGLSPETLAQRQAISQTVANENAGIGDVAMSMFKNPMGALTMGAESAATMLVPGGAGVGLAKAAPAIGKLVPRVANALTPARAGAIGATGANALLNAGDTFGELEGQSLGDRYLGASVPLAVSALLGPGMESMAVKRIIGAADTPVSNSIKEGLSNLGKGALKGGAKEFVSEAGEGGSQAVGEAIGKGEEINPTQVGKQAFLEGALGAAPGAVGGGLSNVKMAEPKNEPLEQIEQTVAKLVEDAQANQAQPEDVVANVLKALGGLDDKYQESKPQEEVKPEPVAEQTEQTPVAEEPQAQTEVRRIDRGILQNRKRDDKDSVNQMRKIANAPDYGRVGYSRDFANGAPVVAFGSIPEEQKGRTDYAVSVTGERIPVQYAVVDADTVSTSNDINGAENPDYGLTDRVTAIAGNGRMTALGQAYRQGSAQAYRQEMTEDTMHGVNPQVIAKMKNPVLVRIMPNERVRDDIGDMSNISSNKSLSAIETARNDANRVDLDSLEFNEDGTPTRDSLSRFVSGMPDTERGAMMDKEGRATVQAVDRLNNAIFAKAYNNDDITAMYAEATDPEAKLVVNALARLAPKMAKLEGCGELDFRNALVDAVNAIVQGKRKGLKMQDILAQQDFLADPDVALFVELFARNPRSNKDVVAVLSEAADFAYNEATKSDEDMFGEVQKASRGDVMNYVRDEFNKVKEAKNGKQAKQQANVQDASGGIGASQNVDGRDTGANPQSNERAGSANAQADEGFSLSGQTEQEIIADEKAEEERQAAAQRQEEADAKQRAKEDFNKEVDSLNESYADNFSLEDDTVSAEDALRGQKPLFSRKKAEKKWRHQSRNFSNLTAEEKAAFDAYLDSLTPSESERIRKNIEQFQNTQWGHIALECVFVRGHIKALMSGETYPVETMLDRDDMTNVKKALSGGLKGIRKRLVDNNILADVAKCGVAVNASFLNCNPSPDCAKFCYAAEGRGGIPLTLIKSELTDLVVANDPEGFAQDIYEEYVNTSVARKDGTISLRLFEKGDGDAHWIPLIKALNKRGIRVHVFSKRAEFLRQVPANNLRLLSIDKSNRHLADENPDLPVAFVYQDKEDIPDLSRLYKRGQVKVTLPVKLDAYMSKSNVLELKRAIKGIADTVCPIDAGSVKIGEWTCERCDATGCAGCYHGDQTVDKIQAIRAYLDDTEDFNTMSLDEQAEWLKRSIDVVNKLLNDYYGGKNATEEQQRQLGYRVGEDQGVNGDANSSDQQDGRLGSGWFNHLISTLVKRHEALSIVTEQRRKVGASGVSQQASATMDRGAEGSRGSERPIRFWGHEKPSRGNVDAITEKQPQLKFSRNPRTGKMDIKLSIAWHGSPHVFETFLTDHIGTGEGAQAHGWGLYFAKSKRVAAGYRERLAGNYSLTPTDALRKIFNSIKHEDIGLEPFVEYYMKDELMIDLENAVLFFDKSSGYWGWFDAEEDEVVYSGTYEQFVENYGEPYDGQEAIHVTKWAKKVFPHGEQYYKDMLDVMKHIQPDGESKNPAEALKYLNQKKDEYDSDVKAFVEKTILPELRKVGAVDEEPGRLFKVEIPSANVMLDEQKPLNEQSKFVQNAIDQVIEDLKANDLLSESEYKWFKRNALELNGFDIYWTIGAKYDKKFGDNFDSVKAASLLLNKHGIKGITYDGRRDGRCYVVFDDQAVKVLEYYSKNKPEESTSGSTVEDVNESLESDKDIGEAFAMLRDSGEVNVVQSIGDLPEEIRSQIEGSKQSVKLVIKRSDNGDIQGLYDPRTRKAYLIADALTDETAKPVFLHELGVHSAYGKNPLKLESQMKLARNMVNNGYAQGNDIAVRVKQRLFDANEIDSMDDPIPMEAAEECLSYLVEETASTDDRGPFRKWFDSLMNAIKQWLRNHGINVNLNEWDFVEMAKGNVVAMARQSGKDMSISYSKKGKKSDVRNKTIDRKEPSYKSDERYGRFTEGGFRPEVSDDVKALRERDKKEEDVQFWKIWDTDEMGNLRWEFGRLVSGTVGKTKLGKDVARLLGNANEAVLVATKMKRAPKGLRMQLRAMKAQIEQAGIDATEISKVMQKLTAEERSLISDYIENEMKADVHPAPYIVEIATKLTDILDKQADELVELGMLSKESRDRYRGHYLPRKYNENKQENFFAKLFGSKSQMRGVAGGHLKGRGIFEEVPVEKVRTYISQGFEVRDPAYVYENGKVLHRQGQFEGMEVHNAKVLVWRDFSRAEREEMGEIRDASFRFAVGYMDTQRDLALGRLFKELASNPEYTSSTARDGFEYIPKTEIPGTSGVFKYGALAGKYVDKTVLSHLAHIESSPNDFTRAFRQGMAFWKEGKTAMNPVSHMNNTVGNFTAAHFAGVNMWDMKTYNKAFNAMRNGNETFKEGQKAGLFTGSFSQEEFVKSLPQELQGNVKGEEGWFKSSGDLAMKILTWGMRDKMRKAYELEDSFFKMAIYIKAREKGLSPEEAVDYAHQYVFVYDTLPQGARALRDWALPFFAWTYQAIPMLANTAAHYPHRMLVPALVLHAINKAFYMAAIAMASDEDDDWVTLWKKASQLEDDVQETMPDYMSGYSALLTPKFLPIGINEATGLPRFFDMSHLIPGGNFFDVNNQMGGIPLPELIVPSHPVLNTVMALIGNRDSFTGRELYKDSDTDAEMLDTTAAYLWKQLSPALAFGNYHWSRLMDGVATATGKPILGYTGITKGGETITLDTAVLRFMGMKVRDYDAEKNAVKNINDNKRLMTEIKSGITRNRKDFGRGAITYEALDEFVKDQREKLERLAEANQKMSEAMGRIKANTKW